MPETLFTIGHSNLSFMRFIALLQANNINHIIDIRSIPYSRNAPWSNKSRLAEMLRPLHIRYTYLGHKLGGKKTDHADGQTQQNTSVKDVYHEAIQFLLQLSMRENLVLLCAEGDPANCHRQHIIAQSLLDSGVKVHHILKDGTIKEAWREDTASTQPNLF